MSEDMKLSSENHEQIQQLSIDDDQAQQNIMRSSHIRNPGSNEDEQVLQFMDSLDSYLSLLHHLSSTLRQGWFDLASARYSMGASRVNGVLLDLKEHTASTYVEVGTESTDKEPHFTLCKWASANAENSRESKDGDSGSKNNSSMRHRQKDMSERAGPSECEEGSSPVEGSLTSNCDQVQKERVKSLAVFGTLVSPKLRSAQSSFETALERLVEIANARAAMLSSFDEILENVVNMDDVKT